MDNLRQEFIGERLHRKAALVKEQVQTQRLKQQQLILKQQQLQEKKQQQMAMEKAAEANADEKEKKIDTAASPAPAKKPRKSAGNEAPKKRPEAVKSPDQKTRRYCLYFTHVSNAQQIGWLLQHSAKACPSASPDEHNGQRSSTAEQETARVSSEDTNA